MPHHRLRYLKCLLKASLAATPILGVMGQRQTGKSTLVEEIGQEYVTLDDEETLEIALKSAKSFVYGRKRPFVIDECQQSPPLFPALKEQVRTQKAMGQFILTGSVRFTSIEEIKESLTGRMIEFELLPFCLTELHQMPLTNPKQIFEVKNLVPLLLARVKNQKFSPEVLKEFLLKGGLPGICFLRAEVHRTRKIRSQIKTILDRDLRVVTRTTLDYLTLKVFLEEIALQQGEVFDLSKAARGARIALNSARRLLSGLESVYLIRSLHKEGPSQGKLVYLEDQGMATFLLRERGFETSQLRATDLNRLLFQQLNAQVKYNPKFQGRLTRFQLRSGVLIDFVVSIGNVGQIGYSVGIGTQASPHQIRSAQALLKKYPKARVLLLHLGSSVRELSAQMIEAPLGAVV